MRVTISQPYRYANTMRVRFTCGVFNATVTLRKANDDIVTSAREFAERLRRYKKDPQNYTGLPYPKGI